MIVPVMHFSRMDTLASQLGTAIAAVMAKHNLVIGKDFAIAISSDAVHYGNDFQYTAFGEGGVDAYVKACDQDKGLLRGPLAGDVTTAKAEQFFATCVKEDQPAEYRLPWWGVSRFRSAFCFSNTRQPLWDYQHRSGTRCATAHQLVAQN